MNTTRFFALFATALMLGFAALTVWPDDAEARRFGGGRSFGSRGSRSFSTPRRPIQRTRQQTTRPSTATPSRNATPNRSSSGLMGGRMGSGLMGGIGGFMLGGLIGSMLFGGGGGEVATGAAGSGAAGAGGAAGGIGGSGIGLLEILLIGGLIWFIMRWMRRQRENAPVAMGGAGDYSQRISLNKNPGMGGGREPLPQHFSLDGEQPSDEISQGMNRIAAADPNFDEARFLDGAKNAFQQVQESWSDWSVDRLRPLLTDRMWGMVQNQANERKAQGRRDIIEKIHFNQVEISEAWQEAGEDWITVRLDVTMVEYTTDVMGKILEGDPNDPVQVEEYWTFTRPVGSRDPNWFLTAVQQPGEVARGSQ